MKAVLFVLVLAVGGVGWFIYSGSYDIGADAPHATLVKEALAMLRDRSIARRVADVDVPTDLESPDRIRRGAGNYDAMCTGCHLKPGKTDSELRRGLYPQPPDFTQPGSTKAEVQFWTIKHGIKASAMPSWAAAGVDDAAIWDLVALIRALPAMPRSDYGELVRSSGGHSHAGAEDHHDDD